MLITIIIKKIKCPVTIYNHGSFLEKENKYMPKAIWSFLVLSWNPVVLWSSWNTRNWRFLDSEFIEYPKPMGITKLKHWIEPQFTGWCFGYYCIWLRLAVIQQNRFSYVLRTTVMELENCPDNRQRVGAIPMPHLTLVTLNPKPWPQNPKKKIQFWWGHPCNLKP